MKTEKFTSFDGTVIQCYLWNDVKNPKGVVQISHGMAEHARRYDHFATFLNSRGYIVFADDHRAHGMTSTRESSKASRAITRATYSATRSRTSSQSPLTSRRGSGFPSYISGTATAA